jgi:hypothetical protein
MNDVVRTSRFSLLGSCSLSGSVLGSGSMFWFDVLVRCSGSLFENERVEPRTPNREPRSEPESEREPSSENPEV